MKIRAKHLLILLILIAIVFTMTACGDVAVSGSYEDMDNTIENANRLQSNQPTPQDINYSLERYNLIRRAYWVNGQREKAAAVICPVEVPLSYITLFTESGAVVGSFVVDGKVSSLNSFLTPDSEYYEYSRGEQTMRNNWIADVDGSYGENDAGIFFFDPAGHYWEWTGTYLYSDVPIEIESPVITYSTAN